MGIQCLGRINEHCEEQSEHFLWVISGGSGKKKKKEEEKKKTKSTESSIHNKQNSAPLSIGWLKK
jgi:hypothetical protein